MQTNRNVERCNAHKHKKTKYNAKVCVIAVDNSNKIEPKSQKKGQNGRPGERESECESESENENERDRASIEHQECNVGEMERRHGVGLVVELHHPIYYFDDLSVRKYVMGGK